MAARVAAELRDARRPLVVTSISAGPEVVRAAANLTKALHDAGRDCWISVIMPEANTMGVAMLGGISVDKALNRIESGEADTLVVLENDLSRRMNPTRFDALINKAKHVIALDCIETQTTANADIVLPVPASVETDGTFVNNEGRAQRFFQVFVPKGDMKTAWRTLGELGAEPRWSIFEDVLRSLAEERPEFAPALEAAPSADWRTHADQKVARMPHRYSGRTSKDANVSVAEPRVPPDPDTPFSFSMEGDQNPPPGPLVQRFWYPGWNSMNSITKFQIEVNGPLHGSNPGKRLIEPSGKRTKPFSVTEQAPLEPGEVWIVPRPRIFGSEELSELSPGIGQLTPPAEITISPELAEKLGVSEGDTLETEIAGQLRRLTVRLDESAPADVASVPANFPATLGILSPTRVKMAVGP